jgi:hypothetical protein
MTSEEYPSLLPPGLHPMTLATARRRFVEAFGGDARTHRGHVLARFEAYLARLDALGLAWEELYLDGSFTTQKPRPRDVDVLVVMRRAVMQALPRANMDDAQFLFHPAYKPEVKERYKTDAYLAYTDQPDVQAAWLDTWGTYRDDVTEKGLARISARSTP